jgi:hypothetical protein
MAFSESYSYWRGAWLPGSYMALADEYDELQRYRRQQKKAPAPRVEDSRGDKDTIITTGYSFDDLTALDEAEVLLQDSSQGTSRSYQNVSGKPSWVVNVVIPPDYKVHSTVYFHTVAVEDPSWTWESKNDEIFDIVKYLYEKGDTKIVVRTVLDNQILISTNDEDGSIWKVYACLTQILDHPWEFRRCLIYRQARVKMSRLLKIHARKMVCARGQSVSHSQDLMH